MNALARVVMIGDGEFDLEERNGPRLAIGLLGEEARDRWACSDCLQGGCIAFVEDYRINDDGYTQGSTFALCAGCLVGRLEKTGP